LSGEEDIYRPASRLNNEKLRWRFAAAFFFALAEEHSCFEAAPEFYILERRRRTGSRGR